MILIFLLYKCIAHEYTRKETRTSKIKGADQATDIIYHGLIATQFTAAYMRQVLQISESIYCSKNYIYSGNLYAEIS